MGTVEVDREVCEAYGRCVATAPDVFALDDDEVLHVQAPTDDQLDRVRLAVKLCPKLALTLND